MGTGRLRRSGHGLHALDRALDRGAEADVVVLAIQGPQIPRVCHDLFDAVELAGMVPR